MMERRSQERKKRGRGRENDTDDIIVQHIDRQRQIGGRPDQTS
jgi:hypothetical protein